MVGYGDIDKNLASKRLSAVIRDQPDNADGSSLSDSNIGLAERG